jgi:hypothetical protein
MTDHYALQYIRTQKHLNCRQQKWIQYLELFDSSIKYIQGRANDRLSRQEAEKRSLGYIVCYAIVVEEDNELEFEEEDYQEEEHKLYATKQF